jgi:NhaA family Na+:H+ antiporter
VIAVFYGGGIHAGALAGAAACVVLAALFHRARVDWPPLYVALGVAAWYATYRSGVHATNAGVAFALITPAHALVPTEPVRRWASDLSDNPSATQLRQMMVIARQSVSPAEHIEARLHPFTSFVILPCFALANAGIELRHGMFDEGHAATVAIAVAVGLVLGKFLGILAASWLAVRARIATLPADVGWSHIAGIAALGGIGFTVSLFITGLAFGETPVADAAKLAILAASMVSAALGMVLLASRRRPAPAQREI